MARATFVRLEIDPVEAAQEKTQPGLRLYFAGRSGGLRPSGNHELGGQDLDGHAALVARLATQEDDAPVRLGARWRDLGDLAEDLKLITGARRLRPRDLDTHAYDAPRRSARHPG